MTAVPYVRTQLVQAPIVDGLGQPAADTAVPFTLNTIGETVPAYIGPFGHLGGPQSCAVDPVTGNLYILDSDNNAVRVFNLDTEVLTTLHLTPFGGGQSLGYCEGIWWDLTNSKLYIADGDHNVIWQCNGDGTGLAIVAGVYGVSGASGYGGAATSANLNFPYGITIDTITSDLYICDSGNSQILKVDHTTHIISIVAGQTGVYGFSGDGGAATSAHLSTPTYIVAINGEFWFSDSDSSIVRHVSGGTIDAFAGQGTLSGFSGDGGAATSAKLNFPLGLWMDRNSGLFICDSVNNRLRCVRAGTITTIVGGGTISPLVGSSFLTANPIQAQFFVLDTTGFLQSSNLPVTGTHGWLLTAYPGLLIQCTFGAPTNIIGPTANDKVLAYVGDAITTLNLEGGLGVGYKRGYGALLESVASTPFTDNAGLLVTNLPAPGDLSPPGSTYTVALPSGSRTTDAFSWAMGSVNLYSLFLASALPPTVLMTLDLFSLLGTPSSGAFVTVVLDADSNITGFPGRLWSDNPPEPQVPDSNGIVAVPLIPTSLLDTGRLYGFSINGGAVVWFVAPDMGGRMNDPANIRSNIAASAIVHETSVVTDNPTATVVASPKTLKDDLQNILATLAADATHLSNLDNSTTTANNLATAAAMSLIVTPTRTLSPLRRFL